MLWVEARILQCVVQSVRESGEFGSNPKVAAETSSEEASSGTEPTALPKGQLASVPVDGPTGGVHQEGVVTSNAAAQSADVDEGEGFVSNQFWLLPTQAGYEAW